VLAEARVRAADPGVGRSVGRVGAALVILIWIIVVGCAIYLVIFLFPRY